MTLHPASIETTSAGPRARGLGDALDRALAVQDRGQGVMPGHQFASGNHTNELVPLWAIGYGSDMIALFVRADTRARALPCPCT